MKDQATYNGGIKRLPECSETSKYTPHSIFHHVSDKGKRYAYHNDIKVYLEQLYCDDKKR